MSKRGTVTDILGNPLYRGDIVAYATRYANRARLSVATVVKPTAELVKGRLIPLLIVQPGIADSGFGERVSLRKETIGTEHVVLVERGSD